MEGALRQLTGTIEQLQYRNQQLEMQLKRMQDDTEYRFQQMGGKGGSAPPPSQVAPTASRCDARCSARARCRRPLRRAAVPTCSIRDSIRMRRAHRAPWETRRRSRRPNRGRTTCRRSGPRVAAPPARRSICRHLPETTPRRRKQARRRQWRRRRRPSHPRLRCAAGVAKRGAIAAATSTQCRAGRSPTCDTAAFGHAAGRVRHGLRLRPA